MADINEPYIDSDILEDILLWTLGFPTSLNNFRIECMVCGDGGEIISKNANEQVWI